MRSKECLCQLWAHPVNQLSFTGRAHTQHHRHHRVFKDWKTDESRLGGKKRQSSMLLLSNHLRDEDSFELHRGCRMMRPFNLLHGHFKFIQALCIMLLCFSLKTLAESQRLRDEHFELICIRCEVTFHDIPRPSIMLDLTQHPAESDFVV